MDVNEDANGFHWAGHLAKKQIVGFFYNALARQGHLRELTEVEVENLQPRQDYEEIFVRDLLFVTIHKEIFLRLVFKSYTAPNGEMEYLCLSLADGITQDILQEFDKCSYETLTAAEREIVRLWKDFLHKTCGGER